MRLIDADWAERKAKEIIDGYAWAIRMAVGNAPTVDAVPLDKLCEWLGKETLPCLFCEYDVGEQCLNLQEQGCWKRVLTKWMEGLDAAD